MEVTSWTHADHTVNLSYFDADLDWGWPDYHRPAGMIWNEVKRRWPPELTRSLAPSVPLISCPRACCVAAQVGPRRPASGNEIEDAPALVELLSDKLVELRKGPGKPGKTVSLNYETSELGEPRSYEVRLNSSGLKTTGFPGGVMRGDFINVNGSYLTVVDPLPCAEFGAQSPASGSSYNQFEITKVDCETHSRTYPVKPDEVWTALWMTIHIDRRSTTTCRLACT
eukprot:scaffold16978_cov71-Phaeocystis_antarctica.AAC.2